MALNRASQSVQVLEPALNSLLFSIILVSFVRVQIPGDGLVEVGLQLTHLAGAVDLAHIRATEQYAKIRASPSMGC